MRKTLLVTVLILCLLIIPTVNVQRGNGAPPSQANMRTFYFAPSTTSKNTGSLDSRRPTSSPSIQANLSLPVQFGLKAPLQSATTILGDLNFSVWTAWQGNQTGSVYITAEFDYRLPGADWVNYTAPGSHVVPIEANARIPIIVTVASPGIPLTDRSSMAVRILAVTSIPKNANVTLNWGSASQPSGVTIPMIGYEALYQVPGVNPITITDGSGAQASIFHVELGPPNNIVLVKVLATSALGLGDIGRVNMTIVDPNGKPVRGETNRDMDPPLLSLTSNQPYQYEAAWIYRANSTLGQYQVWIDIIDIQNNTAFSFRGPQAYASFQLVPVGYIPFPYNLYPYFLIAGAVAGGGAYYYRNRRRRSYLVPFEHFSDLTGGGLENGTVTTIEGNTGAGKTILSEQLMYDDLRSGRRCVFVSTGDFPNNIRSKMRTMGFDTTAYEQAGLLTFIDGYSSEAGQESREKVALPSLSDLTTLGVKISSSLPAESSKGASLYFDSLSPLASKAKPESIVSFVQSVGAKVKGFAGKAFFTLGPGIDPIVQRQLEESADCIVQMEAFEESGTRQRRLRIAKLRAGRHQEGWTRFTIEDGKGIIFYSRKPRKWL